MIKLRLENFQAHKDTTVEIPIGRVTYLEGRSDIGKSAVVRALRWLVENKPDGASFVTFGSPRGTNSRVTLSYGSTEIVRERGKSKNTYKLNGVEYAAFGREPPNDVIQALKLSPYAFQLQGEPSFLISLNPSDTARLLSEACGLGIIDLAVGHIRAKKIEVDSDIRKTEILLEAAQKQCEEARTQLPLANKYEEIAERAEQLEAVETKQGRIDDVLFQEPEGVILDVSKVASLSREMLDTEKDLKHFADRVHLISVTIEGEPTDTILDLAPIVTKAKVIAGMDEDYRVCQELYESGLKVFNREPVGVISDLATLRPLAHDVGCWSGKLTNLESHIRRISDQLSLEPVGSLEDLSDLLKQRDAIKVCPTCGREL